MRTATTLLALIVSIAAPLSAEAGQRRGGARRGGGVMPTQPQAYRKAQTITPESAAVVQARQERLAKLKADLEALAPKATPTKEQTIALYQDLMAVVDGSSKPTPATVQKLAADLATMMTRRGGKSTLDTVHLVQDLKVVMNSAYVQAVNAEKATRASEDLLKAAGTAEQDARAIVTDLKTIMTQSAAQGRPGMIR